MFGRRSNEFNSRNMGHEFLEIYNGRQASIDRSDAIIESVTETPAKTAAEYAQSYYETFYDTPAKKMLWQAEQAIPYVRQAEDTYSRFRYIDDDTLKIDLAEAYSTVMPDEGWRVVQTITDGKAKIEALAKFGNNTDPIFIEQARELVYTLDTGWCRPRIENLLRIADFAQDDISLNLAYEEAMAELARGSDDKWETADYFINAAYLGHGTALLRAKQLILGNFGRVDAHTYHWLEKTALVSYIDELMKRNDLPLRIALREEQMPQYEEVEAAWQDTLTKNREQISAEYDKVIELPRFDNFYSNLYLIEQDAESYSTLSNRADIIDYIDSKAADYAQVLTAKGPEGLAEIQKSAIVNETVLAKTRQEQGRQIESYRARWRKDIVAMVDAITGVITLDQAINQAYESNKRMFGALNRIAVFRGLCLAGAGLRSDEINT